MASSAWNAVVGINLDTSGIKSQLNKALSGVSKDITLKVDTSDATSGVKGLGTSMEDTMLTFQVANAIFSKTIDIISSMAGQVLEVDTALTEFRKVSDLSGAALDKYADGLAKVGSNVARTRAEMIEAATTFRKSGFSDEDAATLATVASTFQNVADTELSAADAASSIISQMKAFSIEASDATKIIDVYNEVANNFAVGTNDISAAMEVAGAGLSVYNNSFEQSVALVTAGSEILQGRSLQVARGLQTISARIATNGEALARYGIQVQDANGNLLSTYDVLTQLKPAWDNMTDAERTELGQTLAGTNQFKVLAAVMQNMNTATEAYATALDAAGSAAEENARYMESLNKMGFYKQA